MKVYLDYEYINDYNQDIQKSKMYICEINDTNSLILTEKFKNRIVSSINKKIISSNWRIEK